MAAREIAHDIPHDQGFVEVADRCWVARFEFLDVNVGVVGGLWLLCGALPTLALSRSECQSY